MQVIKSPVIFHAHQLEPVTCRLNKASWLHPVDCYNDMIKEGQGCLEIWEKWDSENYGK